ncbi:hypothetical protein [Natranaeroarchaeum aerophilus]|uniref:Uncharacterized protein n=1 Tax=Natranaeroarchaeum aerophilus TaxID=2917711 RepID=A0AAE3FRJ8_9EURY|nr:hypothetical protein [Natranaeroarchaeum aerophilus]MCL9814029.1 hypothetical protein [Natranaeroarchaeum aerophilus]
MSDRVPRTDPAETRTRKVLLMIGFLALTVGVLAARTTPATGYEIAFYASTPTLFWIGIGLAGLIGTGVGFTSPRYRRVRQGSIVLTGAAVLSVLSLPLLRSFRFYGPGDSMSHLGWVRMFEAGTLHPASMRYPAVHSIATMLSNGAALADTHALMLTVVVFFALFLLFVPLCVASITNSGPAMLVGVLSGLLLLPINNIGVHTTAHPTSQTIMFVPVVFYLLFGYMRDRGERYPIGSVSGIGLLLGLSAITTMLIHPQQALNLLGAFLLISLVQYGYSTFRDPEHPINRQRLLYDQTALFTLLFLLWVPRLERVRVAVVDITTGLLAGGTPGTTVAGRTVSLAVLGGSLEEMFVKLFSVTFLYVILAGLLVLALLIGQLARVGPNGRGFLQYLIVAAIPASVFFVLFFVADAGDQYFRYFGFVMVLVTLMGAVAITISIDRLGTLGAKPVLSTGIGLLFVVFLVMQLIAFHPSPYIYQPSNQISDGQMSGYETAFDDRVEEVQFAGIRSGPERYVHAYYGTTSQTAEEFPGSREAIPEDAFNDDLAGAYDDRTYVPVTTADYDREVGLFQELRYTERGFQQLEHRTEIDRVQSNGEFELYLIDPDDTDE